MSQSCRDCSGKTVKPSFRFSFLVVNHVINDRLVLVSKPKKRDGELKVLPLLQFSSVYNHQINIVVKSQSHNFNFTKHPSGPRRHQLSLFAGVWQVHSTKNKDIKEKIQLPFMLFKIKIPY